MKPRSMGAGGSRLGGGVTAGEWLALGIVCSLLSCGVGDGGRLYTPAKAVEGTVMGMRTDGGRGGSVATWRGTTPRGALFHHYWPLPHLRPSPHPSLLPLALLTSPQPLVSPLQSSWARGSSAPSRSSPPSTASGRSARTSARPATSRQGRSSSCGERPTGWLAGGPAPKRKPFAPAAGALGLVLVGAAGTAGAAGAACVARRADRCGGWCCCRIAAEETGCLGVGRGGVWSSTAVAGTYAAAWGGVEGSAHASLPMGRGK